MIGWKVVFLLMAVICTNGRITGEKVVKVTSLLPFAGGWMGALSGSQGGHTTNLVRKLDNRENFGPASNYVKICKFDFDEINLLPLKANEEGRHRLWRKLNETDILYLGYVTQAYVNKFTDDIVEWVKTGRGVLFMLLDLALQNKVSSRFLFNIKQRNVPYYNTSFEFDGPFGVVPKDTKLKASFAAVYFDHTPSVARQLTKEPSGKGTGYESENIFTLGNSNLIYNRFATDNFFNENSPSCIDTQKSKFFCNLFARMVAKAVPDYTSSRHTCPNWGQPDQSTTGASY